MTNDEVLELVDICKLMKSDYVVMHDNIVMGSDSSFAYFKKLELDHQLPNIAVNMLDLKNELILLTDTPSDVHLFDINIYNKLLDMHDTVLNMKYIKNISYDSLEKDTDFEEALSLKTAQGIRYIVKDKKYFIPIYNGLLPVVKADKIDLVIYDLNTYSFLCKFIIHKKKKMSIELYLLCMHMC